MLILSKRSKSKAIHSLILTIWLLGKGNIVEIIKDQWLPGVPGKEGRQEWIDGAENLFIGCWHYSIQFCNSGDVTLWGRGERGSENSLSFLRDVLFSVNLKLLYKIKSTKTKKKKIGMSSGTEQVTVILTVNHRQPSSSPHLLFLLVEVKQHPHWLPICFPLGCQVQLTISLWVKTSWLPLWPWESLWTLSCSLWASST